MLEFAVHILSFPNYGNSTLQDKSSDSTVSPAYPWHDIFTSLFHAYIFHIRSVLKMWSFAISCISQLTLLCPQNGILGHLVVVLSLFDSVCLSVTLWQNNFNLGHKFWTIRDITSYMARVLNLWNLSIDTKVNDRLTLTVTFILKIANFGHCWGIRVS